MPPGRYYAWMPLGCCAGRMLPGHLQMPPWTTCRLTMAMLGARPLLGAGADRPSLGRDAAKPFRLALHKLQRTAWQNSRSSLKYSLKAGLECLQDSKCWLQMRWTLTKHMSLLVICQEQGGKVFQGVGLPARAPLRDSAPVSKPLCTILLAAWESPAHAEQTCQTRL